MFGALAYNQNKVDSGEAKVLFSNRMLLGEDGNFSIGECMRSFEMQMPVQLSTKKPILHISINPHPEDVLTDQQLSDIAKEYMRKLGYGDQPYLVYKHTDIDRHHIHIVGLRVDENGRPLNDRFEHRRSKQITRELEKKYGLHPAERKERAERPELKKVDYAAGDVKHQIGNTVKAACYGYRFQSFGEYKALLAAYNVCAEEVKGEINGKPYQGIVYSATNDKGEKTGNPVKASRIGKSVGYEAVQRRMEKSGEAIKNGKLKERTRKIVATAMQTARSRKELEQQLRKRGIDVVFRQNDSGRIYGVTFIDHDSRVVLNGSRLGKEYSANVFNERFRAKPEIYTSQKWKYNSGNNPRIRNSRASRRNPTSFRAWLPCWVLSAVCWAAVHLAVTSRRTPPAKRERRKRSAQGALTNLKTYNYAARG